MPLCNNRLRAIPPSCQALETPARLGLLSRFHQKDSKRRQYKQHAPIDTAQQISRFVHHDGASFSANFPVATGALTSLIPQS